MEEDRWRGIETMYRKGRNYLGAIQRCPIGVQLDMADGATHHSGLWSNLRSAGYARADRLELSVHPRSPYRLPHFRPRASVGPLRHTRDRTVWVHVMEWNVECRNGYPSFSTGQL